MPKETLKAREAAIIQEFDTLPDVDAKYAHLFKLAEALPVMDPILKTDANRVQGCQSTLWFDLNCHDGEVNLSADSDSLVIKGIAALLIRVLDGAAPEDVQHLSMDFIDQLHIWKLPSQRNNGLMAMLDHIKSQAADCQSSASNQPEDKDPCQD